MSEKEVVFRLSRNDAGQIIDGLSVCLENWQKTLNWYDGKLEDPDFFILECSDREEAAQMVEVYADLLESLTQQGRFRPAGQAVTKAHEQNHSQC